MGHSKLTRCPRWLAETAVIVPTPWLADSKGCELSFKVVGQETATGAKRTDQPRQIGCAAQLPALVVSTLDALQRWPGRPLGRLSQTSPAVAARSRGGCLRHSWQGTQGLACSAARHLTEFHRVAKLLHADPGIGLPGQEAAGASRQRDSHQSSSIAHAPPASAFWPSGTTGAARATAADGLEHGTSRSRPQASGLASRRHTSGAHPNCATNHRVNALCVL